MISAIIELYNSIKTPLGGNSIGNFIILIIIVWASTEFIYLKYIEDSIHSKKSFILSSIIDVVIITAIVMSCIIFFLHLTNSAHIYKINENWNESSENIPFKYFFMIQSDEYNLKSFITTPKCGKDDNDFISEHLLDANILNVGSPKPFSTLIVIGLFLMTEIFIFKTGCEENGDKAGIMFILSIPVLIISLLLGSLIKPQKTFSQAANTIFFERCLIGEGTQLVEKIISVKDIDDAILADLNYKAERKARATNGTKWYSHYVDNRTQEYELVTIDGKYYDAISNKVFIQDGSVVRSICLPENVRMHITNEIPKLIIRTRTEDNISREDYILYLNN